MVNNLKKIISEFSKVINSYAVTHATEKLFEICPDGDSKNQLLDKPRAQAFIMLLHKHCFSLHGTVKA